MKNTLFILSICLSFFFGKGQSIPIDDSTPFAAVKNTDLTVFFNPPLGMTGPYTVELREFQQATTPYGNTSSSIKISSVITNNQYATLSIGNHYTHEENDGFGSSVKYTQYLRVFQDEDQPINNNLNYWVKIQNSEKPILGLRNITSSYPSGATLQVDMIAGNYNPANIFTVKLFKDGDGTVLEPVFDDGARVGLQPNAENNFSVVLPNNLTNASNYYIEVSSSDPMDSEITNFFTIDNSIALPITLLNFTAKPTPQGNQLAWQTTSEKNFSHFEIQKSTDAQKFEKIGEVKGSNSESYEYLDSEIRNQKSEIKYYRLRMVDLDGKFAYSKIVSVANKHEYEISVYPNPVTDMLFIKNVTLKNLNLNLLDATGRSYIQMKNENKDQIQINLKGISKGIYFLQINDGAKLILKKIVKQ